MNKNSIKEIQFVQDFFLPNFDKMQIFEKYYPYNNYPVIILKHKKFLHRNSKKYSKFVDKRLINYDSKVFNGLSPLLDKKKRRKTNASKHNNSASPEGRKKS